MMRIKGATTAWFLGFATLFVCEQGNAAGFEIPEQGARALSRGGAFAARADDPSALIHSPGMASRLKGTQILYTHNLVWSYDAFERGPSLIPSDDAYAPSRSENQSPFFPLGASLAATSDFGTDQWVFGFSLYGPSSTGNKRFDRDGGQRYMLTELDALMFYAGASVAWGTEKYGFGATLQWASLPKLNYTLVVDGTLEETLHPYRSDFDMEATLKVRDLFEPTALLGGWWSPLPAVVISLSGRPLPVSFAAKGNVALSEIPGTEVAEQFDPSLDNTNVAMDLILPPTARLGLRWSHIRSGAEVFDIELDLVYEGWSTIDVYAADLSGKVILTPEGAAQMDGNQPAVENDLQDVTIDKKWRDTMSARLGGTWTIQPDGLQLSAGAYYEQGASPQNYVNLDFLSLDRVGVGSGVTLPFGGDDNPFALTLAYSHVFENTVQVDELRGKVMQQRPINKCPELCNGYSGVPANNGTFESSAHLVGFSLNARL